MTHDQLIKHACSWLAKNQFPVIVTEITHRESETPDVIGWSSNGACTVIECKVSRSDYEADYKKEWRRIGVRPMGRYRLYCVPEGLLNDKQLQTLQERHCEGLLEVGESGFTRCTLQPYPNTGIGNEGNDGQRQRNYHAEQSILLSVIRRIGHTQPQGVSIKCYKYQTKNRTRLLTDVSDWETQAKEKEEIPDAAIGGSNG